MTILINRSDLQVFLSRLALVSAIALALLFATLALLLTAAAAALFLAVRIVQRRSP